MYNVLFTAAGGGNTENLVRSLVDTVLGQDIIYYGTNSNKYELAKSNCSINFLNPGFSDPDKFINFMMQLVISEKIDFIVFNHENEIDLIARKGGALKTISFLPNQKATEICINKQRLNKFLTEKFKSCAIVPRITSCVPRSFQLRQGLADLREAIKFAGTSPFWIRTNEGSSSVGAAPMYNIDEAAFWINYWVNHKGADVNNFTIAEYLPGRDIHCFSLWNEGEMLIGKCVERLAYLNSKITLSGTYSSPSMATMVNEPELLRKAQDMIKAIDPQARGLYGIDFKQGYDKCFKLTEINIGRFPRINYLFNKVGPNIAEMYLKLGLGYLVTKETFSLPEEKYYLFREVDTIPILKTERELEIER